MGVRSASAHVLQVCINFRLIYLFVNKGKESLYLESNDVSLFLQFLASTYFVIQVSSFSSIVSQVAKVQG